VFVVCRLLFGVWYQFPLRNLLNLFLSGVQKKPTPIKEQAFKLLGVYCLLLGVLKLNPKPQTSEATKHRDSG